MPWTLFLPGMIWSYFSDQFRLREDLLFLGLWAATVFVFFSLSAGKRPPYILPLYPPLALLIAVWLRDQTVGGFWKTSYFKFVAVFASLTGVVLGAGLAIYLMGLDVVSVLLSLGVAMQEEARLRNRKRIERVARCRLACSRVICGCDRVLVFNCPESLPMPYRQRSDPDGFGLGSGGCFRAQLDSAEFREDGKLQRLYAIGNGGSCRRSHPSFYFRVISIPRRSSSIAKARLRSFPMMSQCCRRR